MTQNSFNGRNFCLGVVLTLFATQLACRSIGSTPNRPLLAITVVPAAAPGGDEQLDVIKGTVTGAGPHDRIVIYTFSRVWYVQPWVNAPYTSIDADGNWSSTIHLGAEYAALLVTDSYQPPARLDSLPDEGGPVLARVISKGRFVEPAQNRVLQFSGYEWEVRSLQSDRGGGINFFSPEHAWVDEQGRLHLRIAQEHGRWVCAEVMSRKSFGYGTYQFGVQNAARLDPRMVVTLFTWHNTNSEFNHREIDVELSRWGDPGQKNSQYVIQPYYVPENIAKFESPPGPVTYSFRWEPDQVTFRSVRGDGTGPAGGSPIFQHTFTSEIPPAGGERVGMNFYLFEAAPPMSGAGAEVIIEKFIFLP